MLDIRRFAVNPFQENCYIVSDSTKEAVIIDCGAFYEEERRAVVGYIKDDGLVPKRLLATHGHIDHNFGNNTVFDTFGLKPEVSGSDAALMDRLAEQAMVLCQISLDYKMPPVGRYLEENEEVAFGSHTLAVLPTPGHSPGSVLFWCKEEGVAFSGDTLFCGSIGRTDFWQGSYSDIMSSLERLKAQLPADTAILPGHGPQTTMAAELADNPYLK